MTAEDTILTDLVDAVANRGINRRSTIIITELAKEQVADHIEYELKICGGKRPSARGFFTR